MTTATLYRCSLRHVRTGPVRHAFIYRTYQWLVDVDDLPTIPRPLRPLARFLAADHIGRSPSLRRNLDDYLATQGVDLGGGQILMLTHARVLGHVFNPLTVYWCHRPDGTQACVVAEVHNTYGGRHCYLLHPDARDAAHVDKDFYVSPFLPLTGTYRMSLPRPDHQLALTVTLRPEGGAPFVASLRGTLRAATVPGLLAAAFATLLVRLKIRRQGVSLYLKGLPVIPRTPSGERAP
ncbi:DUF1365 domain-containing protein [Longispora fulva]|uniref:DUF1365 family protein n=1 Tax=Longispora fulva TaxID=619741 RepID=A0A8J7GT02_9ACTN|nr:DUF1365 domain-containing protein [Longispora fulva]MBG6137788.1 DUF1365 family protein [Longispora fulva]GIG62054.1 DUF1365 domain-containing protein [Longispora fulva]